MSYSDINYYSDSASHGSDSDDVPELITDYTSHDQQQHLIQHGQVMQMYYEPMPIGNPVNAALRFIATINFMLTFNTAAISHGEFFRPIMYSIDHVRRLREISTESSEHALRQLHHAISSIIDRMRRLTRNAAFVAMFHDRYPQLSWCPAIQTLAADLDFLSPTIDLSNLFEHNESVQLQYQADVTTIPPPADEPWMAPPNDIEHQQGALNLHLLPDVPTEETFATTSERVPYDLLPIIDHHPSLAGIFILSAPGYDFTPYLDACNFIRTVDSFNGELELIKDYLCGPSIVIGNLPILRIYDLQYIVLAPDNDSYLQLIQTFSAASLNNSHRQFTVGADASLSIFELLECNVQLINHCREELRVRHLHPKTAIKSAIDSINSNIRAAQAYCNLAASNVVNTDVINEQR